jgi:hypothetical protein
MPQQRQVNAGIMESGVVYEIEFACSTPGPEVEEGGLMGYWTGEIDGWGKLTVKPINHGRPVYLFPGEIVAMQRVSWPSD